MCTFSNVYYQAELRKEVGPRGEQALTHPSKMHSANIFSGGNCSLKQSLARSPSPPSSPFSLPTAPPAFPLAVTVRADDRGA
eukprot:2069738-Rhodomonas_salina.1